MEEENPIQEKYKKAKAEREKHNEAILSSSARKKVVVAGPGTGKTYLFKEVLKGKKNTLTLTFVNALVEDLSLELCGLSDVKTLHGFARSELGKAIKKDVKIFPKLSKVIGEDATVLLKEKVDFDHLFHNRSDQDKYLQFYKTRKDYYDYYGYADVVFAVVKFFEKKKDSAPKYEQVMVDEFQDFNELEVSLINLLAEKSPILLAGDDDQALYVFKSASTDHIRQRHSNENPDYATFSLPYCLRCTRVVVGAANDILDTAIKTSRLDGRISKLYQYYDDEEKDKVSDRHPKISYKQVHERQIPWFIEKCIHEIAGEIKDKFSVLVIAPTKVKTRYIVDGLKSKGFVGITSTENRAEKELTLMDGLKILLDDEKSNLGWRIASKLFLSSSDFESLLKLTNQKGAGSIHEIIEGRCKKEIEDMLKAIRAIKMKKKIKREEFDKLLDKIGLDPYALTSELLEEEINFGSGKVGNPGLRKIPIKVTTREGSKGLSDDYVFITQFDDLYYIKNKDKKIITDQDICNFLVSLTRAKKKVFLISSNTGKKPTFFKWIKPDRIEEV